MEKADNMLAALSLWLSDAVWESVAQTAEGTAPAREDVAVLVLLGQAPLRITDVAAATGRTHSAAVRAVDRLEAAGLVRRRAGAVTDARAVRVELTDDGDTARRDALARRAGVAARAMAALTEGQRHELGDLLQVLLSAATTSTATGTRICRLCDEDSCVPLGCPVEDRCQRLAEAAQP